MSKDVADFFDREAEEYQTDLHEHPMAPFHEKTARRLEDSLRGDVLCIGGLWALIDRSRCDCRITVGDLSIEMLRSWAHLDVAMLICDGQQLPFPDGSFDHLVFPLVLHHLAGRSGTEARANVRTALREAHRVLRDGGHVWVSEFCLPRPVYAVELAVAPLSRRFLSFFDVPLPVMHSAGFYVQALEDAGFRSVEARRVEADGIGPWDTLVPIDGLPWLQVPRAVVPVKATVLTAES